MNLLQHNFNKKYGVLDFSPERMGTKKIIEENRSLIKIVYVQPGSSIFVDSARYNATSCHEIFFFRPDQYIQLGHNCRGSILYYAPHLYASDIDDYELVSGAFLFNGINDAPGLKLDAPNAESILFFFQQVRSEMASADNNQEAMIRTLIKQLLITSTRIWKQQGGHRTHYPSKENDFSRLFDRLVENNFAKHHAVSAYADMLNISPKALSKRIAKYSTLTPSEIIQRRIILEAKRMLIHTSLTVKEIGYKLGYEDPSYFIRFFSKHVNMAPQNFRKYLLSTLHAVA